MISKYFQIYLTGQLEKYLWIDEKISSFIVVDETKVWSMMEKKNNTCFSEYTVIGFENWPILAWRNFDDKSMVDFPHLNSMLCKVI